MITRAEELLEQFESWALLPYGLGAAGVTANIAHQVWQAKRRTREKIQQAGMGPEHTQARQELRGLRKQKYLRPHMRSTGRNLKQQMITQKAKIKDIENKGLTRYHKGLAQNPSLHHAARNAELTTQNPS